MTARELDSGSVYPSTGGMGLAEAAVGVGAAVAVAATGPAGANVDWTARIRELTSR